MAKVRTVSEGDEHGDDSSASSDDGTPSEHEYGDAASVSSVPSATSSDDEIESEGSHRGDPVKTYLEKLEQLCYVLGVNINTKLKELDATGELSPGAIPRMRGSIRTLEHTKKRRFEKLQKYGKELIELWKNNNLPLSKGIDLVVIYSVVDAESFEEIVGQKFLSAELVKQVKDEISKLKSAVSRKVMNKYLARKKKIKELMNKAHLALDDVDFELNENVDDENLHQEAADMKVFIKKLKKLANDRKELIVRVQSLKVAVDCLWPIDITKGLVEKARKHVQELKAKWKKPDVAYDGFKIEDLLNRFWTVALTLHDGDDEDDEDQGQASLKASETRAGTKFRTGSSRQKAAESSTTEKGAGSKTWRIVNASYRVRNLESAVECCTKAFGMEALRKIETINRMEVFLGFGSELGTCSLQLVDNHGDETTDCALKGFGHVIIAVKDVRKVIKMVKSLSCCKIIQQPNRLHGGSVIAYAQDVNGTLYELIQRGSAFDILQGIMIFVRDLDKSIKFYVEVLLMKIIKQKSYKCTLGYDEKDETSATLELRVGEGWINGSLNTKLTIATEDIGNTIETIKVHCTELGGFLQEDTNSKTVSVLDPDGWITVLVERDTRGNEQEG